MTVGGAEFRVEQAGFGWSHQRPGVQLLDHSFASEAEARKWKARLIDHVRILPVGDAPMPDTAWSYFRFDDGTAALLYRTVSSGHSIGRNDSRALIGPASSLTMSVALGFALGDFLAGNGQPPRGGAQLVVDPEACAISQDIREHAEAWWPILVPVLARMLDEPGRPLSIIGCPDEYRLMTIVALCAVLDDQRLERYGIRRFESFSTYEHKHEANVVGLPDLVFLSKKPSGLGVVERVVVDVERDTGEGVNLDEANRILDRFIRRQPSPDLVPVGATGGPPWEREDDAHRNGSRPGGEVRVTPRPVPRRRESPSQHTAVLRSTTSLEAFTAELGRLHSLCQAQQIRQEVRRELDVRALDSVADLVENVFVRQLGSQVLEVVYGPSCSDVEDGTALKHAAEYLARGGSERFTRLLGRAVRERRPNEVLGAVFRRWVDEDPPAPGRGRRTTVLVQRARRARFLPWLLVVTVVALLSLVFLLGVVTGRSPGTQPSAAPAAGPTSVPAPVSSTAVAPVSRIFDGRVAAGYQVFAFLKADELYYPQSLCERAKGATWSCRWDPASARPGAVPVALPVPAGQVAGLIEQVHTGVGAPPDPEWGAELRAA